MTELLNIKGEEIKISLKEITDLLEVQHSKAKIKVEELAKESGFGVLAKMDLTSGEHGGRPTTTYILNKKQAIAVGARLNSGLLMKLVNKLEELENSNKKPISFEEMAKQTILLADKKIKKLENKIEEDKPKVDFANRVANSTDLLLVREYSKVIYDEAGINIGEKKLYQWFRKNGYLNRKNEPYMHFMKYFRVTQNTFTSIWGTKITNTTKITGEGQLYFLSKLKEYFKDKE